jgi:Ca-activated chloride channel family protein
MPFVNLEVLPLRPAVRADGPTTLDVLLRVTPAAPDAAAAGRPPLNLALVLDRSGSMAGARKMDFAHQAAVFAVEQLLPSDRVSVVGFDDSVEVVAASTPATDKPRLIEAVRRLTPRGSTALHDGWAAAAAQVRRHLTTPGLNRVLLLTDGLANVGECNADNICTSVKRQSMEGVTTTTMGVGSDYNEDLLEAMARSGDGNYYFIDSPVQLTDFFQTELRGLVATVGRQVRLAVEPLHGARLADVLNDFERDEEGRLALPNLVVGVPVEVVLRLEVPARAHDGELCRLHLHWQAADGAARAEQAPLALAPVSGGEWLALAPDVAVQERAALLQAARLKKQATDQLEQGRLDDALDLLQQALGSLTGLARTATVEEEERDIAAVTERLRGGDRAGSAKMAKYQNWRRQNSREKF